MRRIGSLRATKSTIAASLLVVTALLTSACGEGSSSRSSKPSTGEPTLAPEPPRPLIVEGTASEKALAYATAFAEATEDEARLAATLGAFTAADLMVIYGGGSATVNPEGQAGIPWAEVWSGVLATAPGVSVSLEQLSRAYVSYFRQPLDDLSGRLMADLRAGISAGRFTALLVAADTARNSGVDLSDATVTADQVRITAPTVFILGASIVQALFALNAPRTGSTVASVRPASLRALPDGYNPFGGSAGASLELGEDCGTGAGGGWVQFIGTKVMGGFKAPGMEWGGVVGKAAGEAGSARLERVLAPANAFLSIISAMVQYGALKATAEAKPLERTKSSKQPGRETNIDVTVYYDFNHTKANNKAFNCIQVALGALGIGTSLPASGPVGGADVEFAERKGFGSGGWVQWWGNNQHMTTSDNGKTFQTVAGQKQPSEVPSSARSVERTYSVDIKVALDPDNEDSLNKFTIDGVACAGSILAPGFGGAALGCLDMVSDLLKQVNLSLGEKTFKGTDWSTGYKVSSSTGYPKLTINGRSCAKENPERGPWTIEYYSDLPVLGRYTGPPMKFTFVDGQAPISARLDQTGEFAWVTSGTAYLVGDAATGWRISFDASDWQFTVDVEGYSMSMGFAGPSVLPDLELQPATDCPP